MTDPGPVAVLFGSQTGNAELIAMDLTDEAADRDIEVELLSLAEIGVDDLAARSRVILISSTYDDGDMPDNAQAFWEDLVVERPDLSHLEFAVLAIGDSSYDDFCGAGRKLDELVGDLGARRLMARVDCDVDYEAASSAWSRTALALMSGEIDPQDGPITLDVESATEQVWTRQRPFRALVTERRLVTGQGSPKTVHHVSVDLGDSGITYEPGDSLGIIPRNSARLVDAALDVLGVESEDMAPTGDTWREALTSHYELRLAHRELLEWVARRTLDDEAVDTISSADRSRIDAWAWGRDVVEVLALVPAGRRSSEQIARVLRPIQHRTYSISSSSTESPKVCDLLIDSVAYHREGRDHVGACSAYLDDGVIDGRIDVFPVQNITFRLPDDDTVPIVMIGPGVGVAPFRGFLRERAARGASGPSWLFIGGPHESEDHVYEAELKDLAEQGVLTRLDAAWSRDQAEKVYVQDKMRLAGSELFSWLEQGAHVYVCGDASHMARDVERSVVELVAEHGSMDAAAATAYVRDLKRARRFLQDVY